MRSENSSRLGFQYPRQGYQQTLQDLDRWLDQINDLPAKWVLLEGTSERAIPEAFLKKIMAVGLEPIIHIPCQLGSVRAEAINPILYSYAHWGLKYVVIYDRPNLKASWTGNSWSASNLVERFVDAILPLLQASHSAGLAPTLPPLQPGGDYWDTAFLKSSLKALARRGQKDLLHSLTLTAYAWTDGKEVDWGEGGPEAWPQARPYFTPEGSQDHRGFRIFEWYRAIASEVFGRPRPVIALDGGAGKEDANGADVNAEISRLLQDPTSAPGLQSFCFGEIPPEDDQVRWLPTPENTSEATTKSFSAKADSGKRLAHYLLLPNQEEAAVPIWRRASAFALTHRPVVGFSVEEACLAQRVTIAADHETIPAAVDDKLQAAGCQVERLTLLPQRKSICHSATVPTKNGS